MTIYTLDVLLSKIGTTGLWPRANIHPTSWLLSRSQGPDKVAPELQSLPSGREAPLHPCGSAQEGQTIDQQYMVGAEWVQRGTSARGKKKNWNRSVFPCPVLSVSSWPAYRFLRRHIRWSGIPISLKISNSLFFEEVIFSNHLLLLKLNYLVSCCQAVRVPYI